MNAAHRLCRERQPDPIGIALKLGGKRGRILSVRSFKRLAADVSAFERGAMQIGYDSLDDQVAFELYDGAARIAHSVMASGCG